MSSPLPEWMTPPPDPPAGRGEAWRPHVIGNRVQDGGTVLVTWALPGLTTATVRVPLSTWLEGGHRDTGPFLGALVASLIPSPPPLATGDGEDGGNADAERHPQPGDDEGQRHR